MDEKAKEMVKQHEIKQIVAAKFEEIVVNMMNENDLDGVLLELNSYCKFYSDAIKPIKAFGLLINRDFNKSYLDEIRERLNEENYDVICRFALFDRFTNESEGRAFYYLALLEKTTIDSMKQARPTTERNLNRFNL